MWLLLRRRRWRTASRPAEITSQPSGEEVVERHEIAPGGGSLSGTERQVAWEVAAVEPVQDFSARERALDGALRIHVGPRISGGTRRDAIAHVLLLLQLQLLDLSGADSTRGEVVVLGHLQSCKQARPPTCGSRGGRRRSCASTSSVGQLCTHRRMLLTTS